MSELPRASVPPASDASGGVDDAWQALLAAAQLVRHSAPAGCLALRAVGDGLQPCAQDRAELLWQPPRGWLPGPAASEPLRELASLYMPLASAGVGRPLVIGHLGQSLDGFVATAAGDSCFVNGAENITHLHRLRALSDAVVVGASTVTADDPRLTTRLVRGASPQRVVLDPQGRLTGGHKVFGDGAAPTLLVCAEDAPCAAAGHLGNARVLAVPMRDGGLDLAVLVERLRQHGLHVLFVEGGGATVSAFLQVGLLDRLQVAVAPLIIGDGRPGVRLPGRERLGDCLRPACRIHAMGPDVLFDCDLRAAQPPAASG